MWLQRAGLDGMRFLGADPSGRPDDVEATLMLALNNRIAKQMEREARGR